MKPDPKREAQRWLSQGAHAVEVARTLLKETCYSDSCFHAEQTGQLALKAFLYGQGERSIPIDSVKALVERCATYQAEFRSVTDAGKILDQFYIPTRYPDALADPALPFETYTKAEAEEAVRLATQILALVQQQLGVPA